MQQDRDTAHQENTRRRPGRLWFVLLSVLLAPGLIIWAHFSETYYRYWVYMAAPILSLMLLAAWWCLITPNPWRTRRRRLAIVLGITALSVITLACLLRPGGSHGGTSLPSFTWRWSDLPGEAVPESPATAEPGEARGPDTTAALLDDTRPPGAADCLTFLGPRRDGRVAGVEIDPDWQTHPPQPLWRQPIGLGWASFAVSGTRAITLEQRGADEWASCYHLATGELLWHHVWEGERFSESMGGDGPRSTPSIEGNRVFTLGGTGILACLRLEDGAVVWQRNILEDAGAPNLKWATTASPLLAGDLVIVPGGEKTGPELLACRQADGERVWQSGSHGGTYSSPRLVMLSGNEAILNVHGAGVAAYRPSDGGKLWNFPWGNKFPKVGQPHALDGDHVLVTASYNQGSHLVRIVPDSDGSRRPEPVWESSRMKTKFSSASVIGDHIYGLDEGTFACVELATGDRAWKDGRYGFGQHLHAGNHLLVLTERGSLVLIDPDPESHRELARLEVLDGKCWAAPALAGTYCLLRSETEAACLKLPGRLVSP